MKKARQVLRSSSSMVSNQLVAGQPFPLPALFSQALLTYSKSQRILWTNPSDTAIALDRNRNMSSFPFVLLPHCLHSVAGKISPRTDIQGWLLCRSCHVFGGIKHYQTLSRPDCLPSAWQQHYLSLPCCDDQRCLMTPPS